MNANRPRPVSTPSNRRARLFLSIVIAAAIIVAAAWLLNAYVVKRPAAQEDSGNTALPQIIAIQENQAGSLNSPERAAEVLSSYYKALSEKDAAELRRLGASDAANAVDLGWLDSIKYLIDYAKLSSPSSEAFPSSAGMYAGNVVYEIAAFYPQGTKDALSSDVTGLTSACGWLYFDSLRNTWVVADPMIPTAVSAPEYPKVQRGSEDSLVTVKASGKGVFANPWWSYSALSVEVTSMDQNADVSMSARNFDGGTAVIVPDSLKGTVPKAGQPNAGKASGDCVLRRGDSSNFSFSRIGAKPLILDGDLFPIDIEYHDEDISPYFAVGTATAENLDVVENYETASNYDAEGSNELADAARAAAREMGASASESSTE